MLNQVLKVLKVSSGKCQQFVEDAVKISYIFGFSTFMMHRTIHRTLATYCRYVGNIYDVYIESFLVNHLVKEFLKIGPHLPQLLTNIKWHTFFQARCIFE